jgi:hypothetical protein
LVLRSRGTLVVAIASAVPLVVLLASIRTSVGFWDTGDLQTVAWIAGIPYPTGFPGYILLGWLWTHAIPVGEVAARLNALSAVSIGAGAGLVAAIALELEAGAPFAVLGAWLFAFARVVWSRATYADSHPLGFALAFAAIACAIRWRRSGERGALVAAILCGAVALGVDNTTVLILPGALLIALARRWPLRASLFACAGGAVLVLVCYAFLPLRSAYVVQHRLDPTLALGIPPGRPYWDDHDPRTLAGFRSLVSGREWLPEYTLARLISPDDFAAAQAEFGAALEDAEPQGLLVVALIGICFVIADGPLIGVGLVFAAVVPALFGASYQAEADPERYVFGLYAVSAIGIAVAASRTARAFGREMPAFATAVVCGLLALALLHDALGAGDILAERHNDDATKLARRVAAVTRDDAIVVAAWNEAAPLAYSSYVQHAFGHRIVVCARAGDHADEYRSWMRAHQIALVTLDDPDLPHFRTHFLALVGRAHIYELLP